MSNHVIKKGQDLVEARYNMSLWEIRILLRMTSMIHIDDKDFELYTIDVPDLKNFFGIESDGSVYKHIKRATLSLMSRQVTLRTKLENGKTQESTIPIISEVSRIIEDKTISIGFHPKMKPYLLELAHRFLSYDVRNIVMLSSPYAVRIYELTRAYLGLGKRTIEVARLKEILDVKEKYKLYGHFKKRVLTPSVENINDFTDIRLQMREIKEGRRVHKIEFTITKQREESSAPELQPVFDEVGEILKSYGVSDKRAREWRAKYSDEYLMERIKYLENQDAEGKTVENRGGYLASILEVELPEETTQLPHAEQLKRARGILFSRPQLERQLRAKHGELSDKQLVSLIRREFPERFEV